MKRKRFRFCGAIALAGLLLALGAGGVSMLNARLSSLSQNSILRSMQLALEQAAMNLNDRMEGAVTSLHYMTYHSAMQTAITTDKENTTMAYQLEEIKALRAMVNVVLAMKGTALVRVYLDQYKLLTREGIHFFPLEDASVADMEALSGSTGAQAWIAPHRVTTRFFTGDVITLGMQMRNPYRFDVIRAVVMIDLQLSRFTEILDSFQLPGSDSHIAITEWDGTPVLTGRGAPADTMIFEALAKVGRASGFYLPNGAEEIAYATLPLNYADWRLTIYAPRASLLGSQTLLQTVLTVLMACMLLLVTLMTAMLLSGMHTQQIHKHLRQVNAFMRTSGVAELARLPRRRQPIDVLDQNIQELLNTMGELTAENYTSQLREREATLRMLQAQVNPHFLYNTLDTIHWMALRGCTEDVAHMLEKLAQYFRLSLSRGQSIVTLCTEVDIARAYLELCACHTACEVQTSWELSPNTLDLMIPKMTLQPIIENALLHGVYCRSEKTGGLIAIRASLCEGALTISVTNNGPGLHEKPVKRSNFGLNNVEERLDLFTGGQYSLTISDVDEGGVIVTLRLLHIQENGRP